MSSSRSLAAGTAAWLAILLLLSAVEETLGQDPFFNSNQDEATPCPEIKCFVELVYGQQQMPQTHVFRLECSGCSHAVTWEATDWLAEKLNAGILKGRL